MTTSHLSATSAALSHLGSLPGVFWSGLMDRSRAGLHSINSDGSTRPSNPTESVLIEAIMSASSALSERIDLDTPTYFEHRSGNGGLLLHAFSPSSCLVIRHGPGAPIPILRLAMRDSALRLSPQELLQNSTSRAASLPNLELTCEPSHPAAPSLFGQSAIYNPFTSA